MCGINGILRLNKDNAPISLDELRRTRDRMAKRGPDGYGEWIDPEGDVGLGHRRLAIIDLSDAGAQPMHFGPYTITFNGEIYNYAELRSELVQQGVVFRSHSDTEVIMALYQRDGAAMLSKLRGMFAFAIWDNVNRNLLLARDPYGIKPLYYSTQGGYLRFASQVKALECEVSTEINPAGLVGFLLWGSVPQPHTIRKHIHSLPAGHYLCVQGGHINTPTHYYQFGHSLRPPHENPIEDSVKAHLVADVPVAVFLSAGLDSSMIAALASRHVDEPLITMTLAFEEFAGTPYDEAPIAAEIARKLGTNHIERRVRRDDFMGIWQDALTAMDQPTIDGFNTFLISQVAHEAGLKVVLSGLGGDELFGSYPSFSDVPRWQKYSQQARIIPGLRPLWPALSARLFTSKPKLAGMLRYGHTLAGSYYLRRGLFLPEELPELIGADMAKAGLAAYDPLATMEQVLSDYPNIDAWTAVHLMESTQYMGNQLLRDNDWASMAHSLELRPPLVDAWLRSDLSAKHFEPGRSQGKAAVVRQAAPELPEAVWNRPKSGFFIPVMDWLDDQTATGERSFGRDSRRLARRILDAVL